MSFKVDKLSAVTPDGRSAPMALEVVFVDDLHGSAPDREPHLQFEPAAVERAIRRVRDYQALFPSGTMKYVTNSRALAELYIDRFRTAGLKPFTFTVVPAVLTDS